MQKELLDLALEIMEYAKSKGFKLNQNLIEHLRVRLQMSSYRDYEKDNELYSGVYSVPMNMNLIDPLVEGDNETLESFDYLEDDDDDYSCFSATIEFKKVLTNIYVNIPIFAFADTPFKILVAMKSCDVTLTKANKEGIFEMLDNFIVSVNNFGMTIKKHHIKKKVKEIEKDFE